MSATRTKSTLLVSCACVLSMAGCGIVTACGDGVGRERERELREGLVQGLDTVVRAADLVFRRGSGVVSRAVIAVDPRDGGFSHIGMIVPSLTGGGEGEGGEEGEGGWQVVHAVPGEPDFPGDVDRVKMEPLAVFFGLDRAVTGAVMRVDNLSDSVIGRLVDRAMRIYKAGTPFDHDYDRGDSTYLYCTELIDLLYRAEAGIDLSQGRETPMHIPGFRGTYLLPGDVQQGSMLRMVYAF